MATEPKGLLDNEPPPADPHALWQHFSATYFSLRFGLTVLAPLLPLWLFVGGLLHGLPLQPSMSAYFFAAKATAAGAAQCAEFPMRTFLVGGLFAIAAGLYLYKGLTNRENVLLNLAAICAVLVAVFPERITERDRLEDARIVQLIKDCPAIEAWAQQQLPVPIHFLAAAALFILLAIVAWQCASHSLRYLPPEHKDKEAMFRNAYKTIAIVMGLCPVTGFVLAQLLSRGSNVVFWVEAAGVCTFAFYWGFKTRELSLSKLEKDPATAVREKAAP